MFGETVDIYVHIASMCTERWVWNNGGMILTGKNESDKKACLTVAQIISQHEIQRQVQGDVSLTNLVSLKFVTVNNTKLIYDVILSAR